MEPYLFDFLKSTPGLTDLERSTAIAEIEKMETDKYYAETVRFCADGLTDASPSAKLERAFLWEFTDSGHSFWNTIYDKISDYKKEQECTKK